MNEGLQVSTKICPVCKKMFDILYCDLWAYKDQKYGSQGYRYYCSYKCKREFERKYERPHKELIATSPEILKPNMRRKPANSEDLITGVMEAIKAGKDPAQYLESLGYDHWKKWYVLREWAKKHKPELFEQMPKSLSKKARTSA